jgi:uncharacterized alkaline shock family protein YloU
MNNKYSRPPGKTTIAPDVLITIASLTALSIDGVCRLATPPVGINSIFKRNTYEGVHIVVENNVVYADLFLILRKEVSVLDVCHNVQVQVARAITEMVGMEVGRVNVHVEDIEYCQDTTTS